MLDVTVVLLAGGLPSTSMIPLEIFACAGSFWGALTGAPTEPRFRVRTATVDGKTRHSMVPVGLQPTVSLADVKRTDLIVVPTAGIDVDSVRRENPELIAWLRARSSATAVAGVCSGVVLLAAAGLLDGCVATTHWGIVDRCRQVFPNVDWQPDRLVTEAGNVFCGGGVYAAIDLSLYLVEHYCGHGVALETAKALLLETPRTSQAAHAYQLPRAHDDEPIREAQRWLLLHAHEAVDLDTLAAKVAMSPRNFARRFKSATGEAPLAYLHRLRIDRARRELESQRRSIEEVSRDVGYQDVAFFRQLFRRHTGVAPREYRARFGVRP